MNARETFLKIESDEGAVIFCKITGRLENPFSKAQWHEIIAFQAEANFPDLSKAQAYSRYLDTKSVSNDFGRAKPRPMRRHISQKPRRTLTLSKTSASATTNYADLPMLKCTV